MKTSNDKEQRFLALLDTHKQVIVKVCYVYATSSSHFDDLYQETLINLWQGMDSFRGDSKISTWIYRTAINTCITWHRRNQRHSANVALDPTMVIADCTDEHAAQLGEMYRLISTLDPFEKAIITMWLDDNSYADIAAVTGMSRANVATRLHRIKEKLVNRSNS